MILDEVLARKRLDVAARHRVIPLVQVEAAAQRQVERRIGSAPGDEPGAHSSVLAQALKAPGVSLIAEAKRASPSKGLLRADYRPSGLALTYAANGAAAVSVLTEERYFGGHLDHLLSALKALKASGLCVPVLRKDFIFEAYQVFETCAAGADALLLIVALLSDSEIAELLHLTHSLGMEALIEAHDATEVERAVRVGARIVGVNNRDLRDFSVNLETFGRLRTLIPKSIVAVAESGVHNGSDVRRLRDMGADAVLVGEAIVTASDTAAKVRELVKGGSR